MICFLCFLYPFDISIELSADSNPSVWPDKGPALMPVWSTALPLTANSLSLSLHCLGLNSHRACEKVASDLGLGGISARYSSFLHHIQLASHNLAAIWQKK